MIFGKKVEKTKSLTGLILLTSISIMSFGLYTQDPNILFYAIPIIYALIISLTRNNKDIDDAVKSIGITGTNIKLSIPIGIAAGVLMFLFGGFLIQLTAKVTASTVPTFSFPINSANVIPQYAFLGVNIVAQFLIVAPAEEIGFRFLAPYIYNSFFKSILVALLLGTLTWVADHVPAYITQNTPFEMYIVLLIFGIVSGALIYITGGLIASVVMHGIFNTLVLITSGEVNTYAYITLVIIAVIMIVLFIYGGRNYGKDKSSPFNL